MGGDGGGLEGGCGAPAAPAAAAIDEGSVAEWWLWCWRKEEFPNWNGSWLASAQEAGAPRT